MTSGGSRWCYITWLESESLSVVASGRPFSHTEILPKINRGQSASDGRMGAIKFSKDASYDEHNNPIL